MNIWRLEWYEFRLLIADWLLVAVSKLAMPDHPHGEHLLLFISRYFEMVQNDRQRVDPD